MISGFAKERLDPMSLVEKIKELAKQRKITIAELERKTGISNGQIRKWDSITPGVDKLSKVADYFDVSVDYLLNRTNNPTVTDEIENDTDLTKQVMFRINTDGLSQEDLQEIEDEVENFFQWRLEQIRKERKDQ